MAKIYSKGTWVDEVLSGSERYNILENGGSAFKSNMQINLATSVATAGTSLTASLMNNIENGVDLLDTKISDEAGGWITAPGTWSYSSADSPTFVISVNANMTAIISVGMRIKLTQTTAKYFIVTAVGTYSGSVTLITVYGGTDYTLANAAITLPYYSPVKAPIGFPMNPDKWTISLSDTTNATRSSPANNTYYQLGSLSVSVPIGVWRTFFSLSAEIVVTLTAVREIGIAVALSQNTGTVTDSELRTSLGTTGPIGANTLRFIMNKEKILNMSSKTTYYLIGLGSVTTDAITGISFRGDYGNTVVKIICAYL